MSFGSGLKWRMSWVEYISPSLSLYIYTYIYIYTDLSTSI